MHMKLLCAPPPQTPAPPVSPYELHGGDQLLEGGWGVRSSAGMPAKAGGPEATGHPALLAWGHYCTGDREVCLEFLQTVA